MRIGLVLSGGVAKGAYQAGFLKALKEELGEGNEIVAISCSSIGIFSGYAYSAGKLDTLEELWNGIHFDTLPDFILNVWARNFLDITLHRLAEPGDNLDIPVISPVLCMPLPHLSWGEMQGELQKKWMPFMLGGMAFPILTGGIRFYRYQIAVDGGAVDNIPILPFILDKSWNLDLILVAHFESSYTVRKRYAQAGIPIVEYDISNGSALKRHSFRLQHVIISECIKDGYKYGKRICSELFAKGRNDLPTLLRVADRHRKEEFASRINNRFTFETFVQRLNEILYFLILPNRIKVRELKDRKRKKKRVKSVKTHKKRKQEMDHQREVYHGE